MVSKYVCDASFCRSKGTLLYAKSFVEYLGLDIRTIINRKNDAEIKLNVEANKIFKSYIIMILFSIFNPNLKWVSLNNLPALSFNRNNILLIHNVFYTYNLYELTKNRKFFPSSFFLKWMYFRLGIYMFPPKVIYVQTDFMKRKIKKFYSLNIIVLPNLLSNEIKKNDNLYSCKSKEPFTPEDYIFFIGGKEPHKMVVEAVNGFLKSDLDRQYNILVIGDFNKSDFVINERVKIKIKKTMSHLEYMKVIENSELCIIPSKHESLCMPLLECEIIGKKCLVAKAEYSLELSPQKYIFNGYNDLTNKVKAHYSE